MGRNVDCFAYPKGKTPNYRPITCVVLFFDVVGFTKDTTNEDMKRVIQKIDNVIDECLWEPYYWNEKSKPNDLILVPTGDGYAIGFHPSKFSNEKVLMIAAELFVRITTGESFAIRMGIAKGPNIVHRDQNDMVNLFGYGINLANRTMSVALENQILVHVELGNELSKEKKRAELFEVKESLVIKHNETIRVFNYYKKGELGNPNDPSEKE
jgi:class 3 adenylate cyclase